MYDLWQVRWCAVEKNGKGFVTGDLALSTDPVFTNYRLLNNYLISNSFTQTGNNYGYAQCS